jgi:hypothetical protein
VFTLPGPIAAIAYQNKAVIYAPLFKTAVEATLTIAADPKHLGGRIGITAVLHSWGSAMTHRPHVHMIVPGGGLSHDGKRWLACRPTFFLSVRVPSRLFRRLFLEKLAAAHAAGHLAFFADYAALAETAAFTAFLAPLRRRCHRLRSAGDWRWRRGDADDNLPRSPHPAAKSPSHRARCTVGASRTPPPQRVDGIIMPASEKPAQRRSFREATAIRPPRHPPRAAQNSRRVERTVRLYVKLGSRDREP